MTFTTTAMPFTRVSLDRQISHGALALLCALLILALPELAFAQPPVTPLPTEAGGNANNAIQSGYGYLRYGLQGIIILIGAAMAAVIIWKVVGAFQEADKRGDGYGAAVPAMVFGGIILTIGWTTVATTITL